jgi:rhamnulokinase
MTGVFAAIDLGASSGRIVAGVFEGNSLELNEVARFKNGPIEVGGELHWDFDRVYRSILEGLVALGDFAASRGQKVVSIGIDTWAVDYGLIGEDGKLLATPRHYRDERNLLGADAVHALIEQSALYAINGLQFQPFNTVYQLAAEQLQRPDLFAKTQTLLLMPDLIGYLLTGVARAESTNASTTGLIDVKTGTWSKDLLARLGLDASIFPELIEPGEILGKLLPAHVTHPALEETVVTVVASHDTASAVVAVPKLQQGGAYLSSGTWSLIGVELDQPVLNEASARANFTNERGVNSSIRFLKNLAGLWLLQESQRTWAEQGYEPSIDDLLADAAKVETSARIDVTDPEFSAPNDMPFRIQNAVSRTGGKVPQTPAQITRCILESLADGYLVAIDELKEITGRAVDQLNIVGGGSQNALLNQLAADRTGIRVVAGPVEATAIGNLIVQASAHGVVSPDLAKQREFIAQSFKPQTFHPTTTQRSAK